ncbi:MAG: hypothetical protein KUG83_05010 [Gammaproteobacteria bacterium]|nr:hypothetical protein [Gammaproteobacteria bacterium]
MQQTKYLIITAALAAMASAPLSAFSSAGESSHYDGNLRNSEQSRLERRIIGLEKKLNKKNSSFKIDGFINTGLARADSNVTTESWGGITNKNDFAAMSNIGIQISFSTTPYTSFTTQLVSRGEESWDMEAEWAYVSLTPTNTLTFRLGRQKVPLYLLSEYIEIGYANPWVYAPDEVYGITGDSTNDGFSVLYTVPSNGWDSTVQAMWGSNEFTHPVVGNTSAKDVLSLSITSIKESTTLRFGYTFLTAEIPTVIAPLPDIPSTLIRAGDTLLFEAENSAISYLSAGIIVDKPHWLIMSEAAQLKVGGWFSDVSSAYLMTGYRFGKVMPHITIAKMKNTDSGARDGASVISASTGAALALPGQLVGAIADGFVVQNQTSYTLGARLELLPSVSVKTELSHITDFEGSIGRFNAAAAPTGDNVNILKFAIDAVF